MTNRQEQTNVADNVQKRIKNDDDNGVNTWADTHWLFTFDRKFAKLIYIEEFDYLNNLLDVIPIEILNEIKEKYKKEFETKSIFAIEKLKGYVFSYDLIEKLYLSFIESKIEDIKNCNFGYTKFVTSFKEIKIDCLSKLLREICTFTKNNTDIFYVVNE